jgi:GDP-4-dehydro-6-deoxy-D-mannose reductase
VVSRILVTGGGGFVGRHLVAALAARNPDSDIIAGIYDGHPQFSGARIRTASFDIINVDDVMAVVRAEKPTYLIHLAAYSDVASSHRHVRRTWAVNLDGTLNVVLALMEAAPECRLVYCSSSEVYGRSFLAGKPLDETALLDPSNPYGASKAAADIMVGQMVQQGLRAVRVRPFNHTGPGQSVNFVVPAFAAQIARIERGAQPPIISVGNLSSQRDFLDIGDVVDAYCSIVARFDAMPPNCVMNLASGQPVSIADILKMLVSQSSRKIEIVQDPARARSSDTPIAVGDACLAQRLLDWTPRVELSSTLASVLTYYRSLDSI